MSYVIRAIGFAHGVPCPHAGQYLEDFDHHTPDGFGWGSFTSDPAKAKQFRNASDAMIFWGTQSNTVPLRPDGKPNKPLTALSIEVEPMP